MDEGGELGWGEGEGLGRRERGQKRFQREGQFGLMFMEDFD